MVKGIKPFSTADQPHGDYRALCARFSPTSPTLTTACLGNVLAQ